MDKLVNIGGNLHFTHDPVIVPYGWLVSLGMDTARLLAHLEDGFSSGVVGDDFGITGKKLAKYSGITGLIAPRLNKFSVRYKTSDYPSRPIAKSWNMPWAYFYDADTKEYWLYRHSKASKMIYPQE